MSKKTRVKTRSTTSENTVNAAPIWPVFAIVIGVLVSYHFLFAQTGNVAEASVEKNGAAHNIVVVDSKAILQAFMTEMEEKIASGATYTEGEVKASGAEFGAEYLRAVKKYRDKGFLVIDKQYALGVPKGSEITEEIGTALNLEVTATPDPFSSPKLD